MKKGKKSFFTVFILVIFALGLLGSQNFFTTGSTTSGGNGASDGKVPCNNPVVPDPEGLHWHPKLRIVLLGSEVKIPANIGLSITCHRVLHTHDEKGELHIEPDFAQDFTLGDFFGVWEEPFSESAILDKVVDADHEIVMTVGGKPSTEFGNLILKDKQQIVIEYRKKQ